MDPNTLRNHRAVVLAVMALISASVLLSLWITRGRPPEIEEISRATSPDSKWIAKVEMVIYGDHHLVNDARYEVRVGHDGSHGEEVLVYSIRASGPIGTSIKWETNEELIIEDTSSVLTEAKKQPHPAIKIEYRPL